jgi:hypothetical protein
MGKKKVFAILVSSLLLILLGSVYAHLNSNKIKLDDNNNNFKLSKAPGPSEQDTLAKPFDESFRELIRLTEKSIHSNDPKNIFDYFSQADFEKIYQADNLGIKNLTIELIDSGMFRNIEGKGQMEINKKTHNCVERVDLVNSDVLVLNCEVAK